MLTQNLLLEIMISFCWRLELWPMRIYWLLLLKWQGVQIFSKPLMNCLFLRDSSSKSGISVITYSHVVQNLYDLLSSAMFFLPTVYNESKLQPWSVNQNPQRITTLLVYSFHKSMTWLQKTDYFHGSSLVLFWTWQPVCAPHWFGTTRMGVNV